MNMAKKGDDISAVLKGAFNYGDEIAFAGEGTVKLEPEISMKLQDFVSKITGKVDDVSSTIKEVSKVGVGKTGAGISLEEVKSDVLKQIHYDENRAYVYFLMRILNAINQNIILQMLIGLRKCRI